MTASFEAALAALAGSMIGGLTTLGVAWVTQRAQVRAAVTGRDQTVRQNLYKQFIDDASKLYGDALMHSAVDMPMLISAYTLISMMRVISSTSIVEKAESALRSILDIYFAPNKTMAELHDEINMGRLALLCEFSSAAREELSALKY